MNCLLQIGNLLALLCHPAVPVDSFCTTYQKQIRAKGEGSISAPLPVRQRIAANEVTYRCLCEKSQEPICKQ